MNTLTGVELLKFLPEYLSAKAETASERTVKNYRLELTAFFEWLDDKVISYDTVKGYRKHRLKSVSRNSVNTNVQVIKSFITYLYMENLIPDNFGLRIRRLAKDVQVKPDMSKQLLTKQQIEQVIELGTTPGEYDHKLHRKQKEIGRLALQFLWRYPIRISELLRIEVEYLQFDTHTPCFYTMRKGKREFEALGLPLDILPEIKQLAQEKKGKGKLFSITKDALRRYLKKGCEEVGIAKFTPHKFRNYAGTYMMLNGASVENVASVMGNTPDTLWSIYRAYSPAFSSETINLYSEGVDRSKIPVGYQRKVLDDSLSKFAHDPRIMIETREDEEFEYRTVRIRKS